MTNRKVDKKSQYFKIWLTGFAAGLAEIIRVNDDPVQIKDVLEAIGLTVRDFEEAGADEYDLNEIRQKVAELEPEPIPNSISGTIYPAGGRS